MSLALQPIADFRRSCVRAGLLSAVTIISFHLAYTVAPLSFLMLVYLGCLFELSRLPSGRLAFYSGLVVGVFCAAQASFFCDIFGPAAIALWVILGLWIALFVLITRLTRARLGRLAALILAPFLWTGLEYFRSELYYLRFSWLNVGYVFSTHPASLPLNLLGMYGIGFCLVAVISVLNLLPYKCRFVAATFIIAALAALTNLSPSQANHTTNTANRDLRVAGVQLEFPTESQVIDSLNGLLKSSPDARLLVLSEYTVLGPIPDSIKAWCRTHHQYLVIGGEDPVSDSQYRDTAFVIDPGGNVVFQQAKSVPIQFFKDGLPATSQNLWDSPWGKIGICICYDLSYTRVTDQLIRLGAQAIIVPSMDVIDWGKHQHKLHARVAPVRAAEYGVPIFRLASSGISQSVDSRGLVLASAPVPGDGAFISSRLKLGHSGSLPLDRLLAPLSVVLDGLLLAGLALDSIAKRVNLRTTIPIPT